MRHDITETALVITGYIGSLLFILGFIFLIPLAYGFLVSDQTVFLKAFLIPAVFCLVIGSTLRLFLGRRTPNITQAMLICTLGWVILSAAGAIPYVLGINAGFLDAYFETMSGFTTTGITMFTGLDSMPQSIILWRSLTQWVGGLGILTFFLAVTSQVPGAHMLFGAESHKIGSSRPVPGMAHTVKILWSIYTLFTALVAGALVLAGMSVFDGINHSMTALSTGGFSPHDASIAWFSFPGRGNHVLIQYVLIAGMIAGGSSFLMHYRLLRGSIRSLWDSIEMRLWWSLIICFTGLIVLEHFLSRVSASEGFEPVFRTVIFQVTSILTTTGFGTASLTDTFFGTFARQLFLVMMVTGGCVGSTGGGIKVLRVAILWGLVKQEVRRLFYPSRAINRIVIDGSIVDRAEVHRVAAIFFSWILLLLIGGGVTALLSDLDGYTSFSGMFSALGNIGPSFMTVAEGATLHPLVKIVYIVGMLAGRLEILPVLLLFSPAAWKR
jgi:trk system potassium uptake protein TrkH